MNRRNVLISLLATTMVTAGSPMVSAGNSNAGIAGRLAPELKVPFWIDGEGQGTDLKLAGHQGKWVFLKCFQSWCPGCHSHGLPTFKRLVTHFEGNAGIAFAGIQTVFEGFGTNTVEKVRRTQIQCELNVPMGHDPGPDGKRSTTMMDYRTGGTPWLILIAPTREVIFNGFGINVDKAIGYLDQQLAA